MTRNTKTKNYLEAHPGATIEDYNNQRHKMHVQQARITTYSKHIGSKSNKTIMYNIHKIDKNVKSFIQRLIHE